MKNLLLFIFTTVLITEQANAQQQGNGQGSYNQNRGQYNSNQGQYSQNAGGQNIQGPGQNQSLTPQQKAQKTAKNLQKKLGLSQDQAGQVYNIALEFEQQKDRYESSINNVLTPAQQQNWAQLKAEEQARKDAKKQQNANNQGYGNPYSNPNNQFNNGGGNR